MSLEKTSESVESNLGLNITVSTWPCRVFPYTPPGPGASTISLGSPFQYLLSHPVQKLRLISKLGALSACPVTGSPGEETDPASLEPPFRELQRVIRVSPKRPPLQAQKPQLPQLQLPTLVLQRDVVHCPASRPYQRPFHYFVDQNEISITIPSSKNGAPAGCARSQARGASPPCPRPRSLPGSARPAGLP